MKKGRGCQTWARRCRPLPGSELLLNFGQVPGTPAQNKEGWQRTWAQRVSSEAFGHSPRVGCLDEPWAPSALLYAQENPPGLVGRKQHPRPVHSLFKPPGWPSRLNSRVASSSRGPESSSVPRERRLHPSIGSGPNLEVTPDPALILIQPSAHLLALLANHAQTLTAWYMGDRSPTTSSLTGLFQSPNRAPGSAHSSLGSF